MFFWFLQQRQLARQLLCVPEHLDVTLKWRNFRAHLPWMDFPVQFPDVLDACHGHRSARMSDWLRRSVCCFPSAEPSFAEEETGKLNTRC